MADIRVCMFFAVLLVFVAEANVQHEKYNARPAVVATSGSPWPLPRNMTTSQVQYQVNADDFKFTVDAGTPACDIIIQAFVRYKWITFGPRSDTLKFRRRPNKANAVNQLTVHYDKPCDQYLSLESDESYTLAVTGNTATLTANEVWGALRGLETFSQLVLPQGSGMFVINSTLIRDAPRFKHRGVLLDGSRHFLSVLKLKENLEAMAQNKFNVFHWHIVDDQAFPYESIRFPNMSKLGAYDDNHIYSQADIQDIIEFARVRGIRVVPEFDSPGHTQSWGSAISNLLTKCYNNGSFDGSYGPVNPADESSYNFLDSFFGEVANVFPDHYIHLGGDEVDFSCWESNPEITEFMQDKGFGKNYSLLEEFYMQNLLNIVSSYKKGYLIWQEVIDNGAKVAADTVVEVWKGGYIAELAKVTSLGYKTLLSSCWYLDYISYGSDWRNYYTCDPQNFNGTSAQKALVIGGETCLWGEYVDDTNVISRLWPRASAIAERLWSDESVNSVSAAEGRMEEHRCRMVRRGFNAQPMNGPGFCPVEFP
ncbi:hypothetical protein ACJMK2_043189 [Sinanodonta woodiana]|uniref:Beta-hexosaminidase n=1 Tax=Sinanodonta woodiana TaxID=1069815 RepID=A0ABD3VZR5_SINWO